MPSESLPSCSFCGSSQSQVEHLIAGTQVYICDRCVSRALAVIAEQGQAASTPIATIEQVSTEDQVQCSFCGKHRHKVQAMAAAALISPGAVDPGPDALRGQCDRDEGLALPPGDLPAVCDECLELCDEITAGELDEPSQ